MWEFDPMRPQKPHSDKRTYQDLARLVKPMRSGQSFAIDYVRRLFSCLAFFFADEMKVRTDA
jgi:hypothetical protein